MIKILQTLTVTEKDGTKTIIPKGDYKEVPEILKKDINFLHYVNSRNAKGHPDIITGYVMTASEKTEYASNEPGSRGVGKLKPVAQQKGIKVFSEVSESKEKASETPEAKASTTKKNQA